MIKRCKTGMRFVLPPMIVFCIALYCLYHGGYAPFGTNSLMDADANIQYRYLFSYLRDVLQGKNNISYSFSIGMGQTGIGILAYYLMSPLNLAVIFFEKSQINSFFDLLVAVKLALAAFTMAIYLNGRFKRALNPIVEVLLSCSWGLMQYSLEQCDNIMWLDGVILLPIILLNVYRLIRENRRIELSITVAISIVIQWYTAGINCIFAVFWFFLELYLASLKDGKQNIRITVQFFSHMLLGVLLSAAIFLPAVFSLMSGKGGALDWGLLENRARGNVLTAIPRYTIGATSSETGVSLFAGSITLIGVAGLFRIGDQRKRAGLTVFLILSLFFFYWQPFFGIFSLMKNATSYWYRYSYIAIFSLIFIAGICFTEQPFRHTSGMTGALLFSFLLLLTNEVFQIRDEKAVYITIGFILTMAVLLRMVHGTKKAFRAAATLLLFMAYGYESILNADLLFQTNRYEAAGTYMEYTKEFESQLSALHTFDPENYRITTTEPWIPGKNTAHYLELQSEGEKGLATYTSCPDYTSMRFLEKCGYRVEGDCIQIVNTSILPVDALLGVKYMISPYPIQGYELMEKLPTVYGKSIYRSEYAMPLAMKVKFSDDQAVYEGNPFQYVNQLYRQLFGIQEDIFKPLDVIRSETEESVRWDFTGADPRSPLYGNIPFTRDNLMLHINGQVDQPSFCWLAPSVFYIPVSEQDGYLELMTSQQEKYQTVQIYQCDLGLMKQIAEEAKLLSEETGASIRSGHVECHVSNAEEGEMLWLPIPTNKGWKAYRNGESVPIQPFAQALTEIPLTRGENHIEMKYEIPGIKSGIMLSLIGGSFLCGEGYLQRKDRRKRHEKSARSGAVHRFSSRLLKKRQ